MEIKHGRLSMAAFLGVITTYSGLRWPGYLSTSMDLKFSDIPGGAISSWAALPAAAWFQIVLIISFCEVAFLKQDPAKAPGATSLLPAPRCDAPRTMPVPHAARAAARARARVQLSLCPPAPGPRPTHPRA